MRGIKMKKNISWYLVFMLLLVSAFSFSGCSKLFGPSDADVIKALNESGVFKDLNMQSPIVVLEKGRRKDGSWAVKVKIKFNFEMQNKQMSAPVEKTPVYNLYKTKDDKGHTVWKVKF
jgi:hypothetical protein